MRNKNRPPKREGATTTEKMICVLIVLGVLQVVCAVAFVLLKILGL